MELEKQKFNQVKFAAGRLRALWGKAKAGNKCFKCNKAIGKDKPGLELKVDKAAMYNDKVLTFSFWVHRFCLVEVIESCPYENIETLKELDLTKLSE